MPSVLRGWSLSPACPWALLPMPHQDGDGWPHAGCCHHSPAFAVTCSHSSPCQDSSPQVSLIFLHTGDKRIWQPCLVITPLNWTSIWYTNKAKQSSPTPSSSCSYTGHIRQRTSSCNSCGYLQIHQSWILTRHQKMKGSFIQINRLCCIYRHVRLWKPHALDSLALLLIGMFFL